MQIWIFSPTSHVHASRFMRVLFYEWISPHQFRHRCIVLTHIEAYRRRCRAYWLFCAARSFLWKRESDYKESKRGNTFRKPWVSRLRNHVSFGRSSPSLAACIMIHYATAGPRESTWTITESLSSLHGILAGFSWCFVDERFTSKRNVMMQ